MHKKSIPSLPVGVSDKVDRVNRLEAMVKISMSSIQFLRDVQQLTIQIFCCSSFDKQFGGILYAIERDV